MPPRLIGPAKNQQVWDKSEGQINRKDNHGGRHERNHGCRYGHSALRRKCRRLGQIAPIFLRRGRCRGGAFDGNRAPQAQQPQLPPERGVVVIGEASVSVPPDYARVRSGVTTRAKTAKEATEANTKAMAAVTAMLSNAGIAQKDIQTARFSVQPIYEFASVQQRTEIVRVQRLQPNQRDDPADRQGRRDSRSAGDNGSDRRRQRGISAFRAVQSARSGAARPRSPMRGARRNCMRTLPAWSWAASTGSRKIPATARLCR